MKISKFFPLLLIVLMWLTTNGQKDVTLSPYIKAGVYKGTIAEAQQKCIDALTNAGFDVIGNYNPEKNLNLSVVVFTSRAITNICLKIEDRGALAAALKVGFVAKGNNIDVSFINPLYLFNAYFMDNFVKYEEQLTDISKNIKQVLMIFNGNSTSFGGNVELEDLREYQYMFGMEEFTDPVELHEFDSFEQGLATITKNLNAGKGSTKKVYELIFKSEQVAVFGVALLNKEDGELFFLPIIGEDHVAALPYEIILQGKEATMLHGRFRIALHWPDLTMGTFTKIISTPGYIKDTMESLCE